MKHNFHERKQNRINHAQTQAAKKQAESNSLHQRSNDAVAGIPPGQPILIGHHSEKRHRATLDKSWALMGASVAAGKKAEYYADRAAAISNNTAISSDDPDALPQLRSKLEALEKKQQAFKDMNKLFRKNDKAAFMQLKGATKELWAEYGPAEGKRFTGIPSFMLTNNGAKIRATKQRIEQLEKIAALKTDEKVIKGVTITQNVEANRLQLRFPGKPDEEVRKCLKSYGFVYSYSEGAWQRKIGNGSYWAAKAF